MVHILIRRPTSAREAYTGGRNGESRMSQPAHPNFLFITTDQQRWDAVGIHNPVLRTPCMDRLAREGVQFSRMYPTNAICMPSRASMITGRSQRGHQVFNHDVNLSEAIPVLGDSLREGGI